MVRLCSEPNELNELNEPDAQHPRSLIAPDHFFVASFPDLDYYFQPVRVWVLLF